MRDDRGLLILELVTAIVLDFSIVFTFTQLDEKWEKQEERKTESKPVFLLHCPSSVWSFVVDLSEHSRLLLSDPTESWPTFLPARYSVHPPCCWVCMEITFSTSRVIIWILEFHSWFQSLNRPNNEEVNPDPSSIIHLTKVRVERDSSKSAKCGLLQIFIMRRRRSLSLLRLDGGNNRRQTCNASVTWEELFTSILNSHWKEY